MAQDKRFLDVWIVDLNSVYREVPFTVVVDWIQQGRLLAEDKVKPSGTADWYPIGSSPDFTPYLPRPEPFHADDQAEALEPVQMDIGWKKKFDEEEDDPDMIPLIDVSLVLLVFFMLTAAGVTSGLFIPTPPTYHGQVGKSGVWIGVDLQGANRDALVFSVGDENRVIASKLQTSEEAQAELKRYLQDRGTPSRVIIRANPNVKAKETRDLVGILRSNAFAGLVESVAYGTSEKTE
jgi:biopolymer transport protein ExbD